MAANAHEDPLGDQDSVEMPNFQSIYSFLGSLFDPSTSDQMEDIQNMGNVDKQVVQVLMQNLASNLGKHHMSSELDLDPPAAHHINRAASPYDIAAAVVLDEQHPGSYHSVNNNDNEIRSIVSGRNPEGTRVAPPPKPSFNEAADLLSRLSSNR